MTNILFIIIGAGMGHLTRGLAVARQITRLQEQSRITFFTVTDAADYVRQYGYEYEHFPKFGEPGARMSAVSYNQWMGERLNALIDREQIDCIVFDGAFPFDCIIQILRKRQDMIKIWLKREGDRQQYEASSLSLYKKLFHRVILPSEAGECRVCEREKNEICVPPIIQLMDQDILSRESVRDFLKVSEHQRVWYLQIHNRDAYYRRNLLDEAIHTLLENPDSILLLNHTNPVTQTEITHERIRSIETFPIAKYFQGVDFAITAAGYNTVHELVYHHIPSIFVPDRTVLKDDQCARSRRVEALGGAVVLEQRQTISRAVHSLMIQQEKMRDQLALHRFQNGSEQAAKIILQEEGGRLQA